MPCSHYSGGQRRLCFATEEWAIPRRIKRKKRRKGSARVKAHKRGGKSVKAHRRKIKLKARTVRYRAPIVPAFRPRTERGIEAKRFLEELADQERISRSELARFRDDPFDSSDDDFFEGERQ